MPHPLRERGPEKNSRAFSRRGRPAGFVAPAGSGSQADSVAEEVAKIEKYMRENRAAYNKDAKAQERLRTLYDAQEKLASR